MEGRQLLLAGFKDAKLQKKQRAPGPRKLVDWLRDIPDPVQTALFGPDFSKRRREKR